MRFDQIRRADELASQIQRLERIEKEYAPRAYFVEYLVMVHGSEGHYFTMSAADLLGFAKSKRAAIMAELAEMGVTAAQEEV